MIHMALICSMAVGPSLTPSPASVTVTEGDTAVLTCTVTGDPSPVISWYHSGTQLAGETQTSLTLEGVEREEEGMYECVASNQVGDDRATITLVVQSKSSHRNFLSFSFSTSYTIFFHSSLSSLPSSILSTLTC